MSNILIGHTGFVGSNLARQTQFSNLYNSSNIEEIRGKRCKLLVCCGAPAEKWKANNEPKKDLDNINRLISNMEKVTADNVILISTVDVYANPVEVDEDTEVDVSNLHAYGRNRRLLEEFVSERMGAIIIRLPGVFGNNLKKNAIFDFIHNNQTDLIHTDSVYQFYFVGNLWRDINTARINDLNLVNLATPPLSIKEIVKTVFERDFVNRPHDHPAFYDMRTKHDPVYGGSGGYISNKASVLSALRDFVSFSNGEQR